MSLVEGSQSRVHFKPHYITGGRRLSAHSAIELRPQSEAPQGS